MRKNGIGQLLLSWAIMFFICTMITSATYIPGHMDSFYESYFKGSIAAFIGIYLAIEVRRWINKPNSN